MANKLIIKKSSVAGKVPLNTDLDYGEMAMNTADGSLYLKRESGTGEEAGGIVEKVNGEVGGVFWKGDWKSTDYLTNDMVKDGDWTMIANKDTLDRAAPQPFGDPFNPYDGEISEANVVAKQIVYGQRYTAASPFYVQSFRVYSKVNNRYSVYQVTNPTTNPQVTELLSITSGTNGWMSTAISPMLVEQGAIYDLIVQQQEISPEPMVFTGSWNYILPNNPTTPTTGQITHSDKTLDTVEIFKIDNDAVDQSTNLGMLVIGDIIDTGSTRWAIQSVNDMGTYISFGITPQTQVTAGVSSFSFETVVAEPITYGLETDFWLSNADGAVQGLFIADGGYGDIAVTNNAYGVDITVQNATISDDWDLVAKSGGGGGSGSSGGGASGNKVENASGSTYVAVTEVTDQVTIQAGPEDGNIVVKPNATINVDAGLVVNDGTGNSGELELVGTEDGRIELVGASGGYIESDVGIEITAPLVKINGVTQVSSMGSFGQSLTSDGMGGLSWQDTLSSQIGATATTDLEIAQRKKQLELASEYESRHSLSFVITRSLLPYFRTYQNPATEKMEDDASMVESEIDVISNITNILLVEAYDVMNDPNWAT